MSNIDNAELDSGASEAAPTRTRVSRRTLMKTAAGAGIAAATVGIVGVASAATSHRPAVAGGAGQDASGGTAPGGATPVSGQIMVHLVDQAKGTVEVYTPTSLIRITDHDLATRIARAAGN